MPFYLRTGKRLPARVSEIAVEFRRAPLELFRGTPADGLEPNLLIMRIQPDEGISLRFQAKVPGAQARLDTVDMAFNYADCTLAGVTPALAIDGIIGYSLRGRPRGEAGKLIRWANAVAAPVLSLDVPSGLDAATGQPFDPTVQAEATLTLALPKQGLRSEAGRPLVGELYLADIGVPPRLYARPPLALQVPDLFATHDLVRLW